MKNQLIDLTCHDVSSFEPYVNEEISFPVGVVALAKNQAVFFILKGAKPEFGGGEVQYSDTALLCITCTQEFIFHDYAGLITAVFHAITRMK